MFRGPLHDRGNNGRCTECGEPFPCPTGLAIYDAVVGKERADNPDDRLRPHPFRHSEHCASCAVFRPYTSPRLA